VVEYVKKVYIGSVSKDIYINEKAVS